MVRDRCESRGQAVNEVMRKFCEDVERRKAPVGVLAALDEQPREA
jgi:hypothetical protein